MTQKRNDPKPKPIEQWSSREWEVAYNQLLAKYEKLRESMRGALQHLNKAV